MVSDVQVEEAAYHLLILGMILLENTLAEKRQLVYIVCRTQGRGGFRHPGERIRGVRYFVGEREPD